MCSVLGRRYCFARGYKQCKLKGGEPFHLLGSVYKLALKNIWAARARFVDYRPVCVTLPLPGERRRAELAAMPYGAGGKLGKGSARREGSSPGHKEGMMRCSWASLLLCKGYKQCKLKGGEPFACRAYYRRRG